MLLKGLPCTHRVQCEKRSRSPIAVLVFPLAQVQYMIALQPLAPLKSIPYPDFLGQRYLVQRNLSRKKVNVPLVQAIQAN